MNLGTIGKALVAVGGFFAVTIAGRCLLYVLGIGDGDHSQGFFGAVLFFISTGSIAIGIAMIMEDGLKK